MATSAPPLSTKPSKRWDRLKPVRQDSLEIMGFVSKGDIKLLDPKVQEEYYRKIVVRYMQYCATHDQDITATDVPWAAVGAGLPLVANDNATCTDLNLEALAQEAKSGKSVDVRTPDLSVILTALRKLRESLLATSTTNPSPQFSQRVHIFNIKVAILAQDADSYHPSLTYLLQVLHTPQHPLPRPELLEMTTYAILDLALRQNDSIAAYELKHQSKEIFKYENRTMDALLRAVIANNWVEFWRIRSNVDGYVRALMDCHVNSLRKSTLKVFGRAFLKVDLDWLLQSTTGAEMTWDELVLAEQVGWQREGETIIIRRPRVR